MDRERDLLCLNPGMKTPVWDRHVRIAEEFSGRLLMNSILGVTADQKTRMNLTMASVISSDIRMLKLFLGTWKWCCRLGPTTAQD
jgi:hypothetical protein